MCYNCNPRLIGESWGLRFWDTCCLVMLVFVCFSTPLEVAFMDVALNLMFVTNMLTSFVFLLDMVLQFFVPFDVIAPHGGVERVYSKRHIARNYLKSWFIIDFVSIMPIDVVSVVMEDTDVTNLKMIKAIRLVRLVKLIRLAKGLRIWYRYQTELAISYRKTMLVQLFLTIIIAAHWLACTLGMVSRYQGNVVCLGDHDPLEERGQCVVTWMSRAYAEIGVKPDAEGRFSVGDSYLVSLETAISILVHPYFAGAAPSNSTETFLFCMLLLLGGFTWTRVISKTTAMFTSLDRHNIFYHQTMDDLNDIVASLGIANRMVLKLRIFFMSGRDVSVKKTWQDILSRMSPTLRNEVLWHLNKNWVKKVPYLQGCSYGMITTVAANLNSEVYAHKEYFGEDFHLYIVSQGRVIRFVFSAGQVHIMKEGDIWGEEHIVLSSPQLLSNNIALAISYLEVKSMHRETFYVIANDYPENIEILRKYYIKFAFTFAVRNWRKILELESPEPNTAIPRMESGRRMSSAASAEEVATESQTFDRAGSLMSMGSFRRGSFSLPGQELLKRVPSIGNIRMGSTSSAQLRRSGSDSSVESATFGEFHARKVARHKTRVQTQLMKDTRSSKSSDGRMRSSQTRSSKASRSSKATRSSQATSRSSGGAERRASSRFVGSLVDQAGRLSSATAKGISTVKAALSRSTTSTEDELEEPEEREAGQAGSDDVARTTSQRSSFTRQISEMSQRVQNFYHVSHAKGEKDKHGKHSGLMARAEKFMFGTDDEDEDLIVLNVPAADANEFNCHSVESASACSMSTYSTGSTAGSSNFARRMTLDQFESDLMRLRRLMDHQSHKLRRKVEEIQEEVSMWTHVLREGQRKLNKLVEERLAAEQYSDAPPLEAASDAAEASKRRSSSASGAMRNEMPSFLYGCCSATARSDESTAGNAILVSQDCAVPDSAPFEAHRVGLPLVGRARQTTPRTRRGRDDNLRDVAGDDDPSSSPPCFESVAEESSSPPPNSLVFELKQKTRGRSPGASGGQERERSTGVAHDRLRYKI